MQYFYLFRAKFRLNTIMNIESVPNLSKPNRLWIFFVVAVVLAIGATLLSSNYLSKREADIARELKKNVSGGPTVKVLVSSRDLPRGAVVGEMGPLPPLTLTVSQGPDSRAR